jgi:hypothetical protein
LVVAWPTDPSATGAPVPVGGSTIAVPTPDDIVVLRRTDRTEALAWRHRLRAELGDRIANGAVVTDFTREGTYILHTAD